MVIQKSFRQFQHEKRLPEQERTIAELEAKAEEIVVANQEARHNSALVHRELLACALCASAECARSSGELVR